MIRKIPAPVKDKLKTLARTSLGLDIRFAPSRKFDIQLYEGNTKYTRRLFHFECLLQQVEHVEGRIVECGVGPGRSIFAFSVISQHVTRPRQIWGFDTFEGMPPPTEEDGKENRRKAGIWNYPRQHVAPGGIVAFDEYNSPAWPGATQAIDEFFADRPEQIVKSSVVDLYYVVKQPNPDQ